jgi:hypothetical protein
MRRWILFGEDRWVGKNLTSKKFLSEVSKYI